jgi:hypothetical protein
MKIRPVGAEFFHADRITDRYDAANNHFLQLRTKAVLSVSDSIYTEVISEWNAGEKIWT